MARLASSNQLYVLNREGWLAIRDEPGEKIDYHQADAAIKHSIELYGDIGTRKPDPRWTKATEATDAQD